MLACGTLSLEVVSTTFDRLSSERCSRRAAAYLIGQTTGWAIRGHATSGIVVWKILLLPGNLSYPIEVKLGEEQLSLLDCCIREPSLYLTPPVEIKGSPIT